MREYSIKHDTFSLERTYNASPARVYAAWADPASKANWFAKADELDFCVGGREIIRGGEPGGPIYASIFTFQEIVPDNRIVYTATIDMGEKRISVSVMTVELEADGTGTKLVYTELCAFLDDLDSKEAHIEGANDFLDKLEIELRLGN
ncbi:SRPBCC domain-containing protein [Paenibacillus durus]|uniref:Polyketide cyclase n=1 Tax=Paenibacillus durus TaxID=44251 RepID=A0A089IYK1_PAEDU|nr:SRPBCC domain-containing protein [Paenibacillus durus]AIQ14019.1 polyketide cyclase [Paenibacillus durus]